MWQFNWYTAWEEIWSAEFQAYWENLLASSPTAHVFFAPSLVRAWVTAYSTRQTVLPRFLVARLADGSEVFLPLVELRGTWQDAWRRLLVPVGHLEFDYHDPIPNRQLPGTAWKAFWDELRCEARRFGGIGRASLSVNGVRAHSLGTGQARIPVHLAPFVDLSAMDCHSELLPTLPARLRGDIRRQWRRLEKQGDVTFRLFSGDETAAALQALPGLLEAHRRRWPLAYRAPGFHEQLVQQALPSGQLHLSLLTLDDTPLSWHLGFSDASRYYWYMPAYDPAYAAYSPGKLHLFCCMQDALARGLAVFDMLKGNEPYKHAWTRQADILYGLDWNPRAAVSHALLNRDKKKMGLSSLDPDGGRVVLAPG